MKDNIKELISNKLVLGGLLITVLACFSLSTRAALVNGQTELSIVPKYLHESGEVRGSYFTMGGQEPQAFGVSLTGYNGILLGQGQPAGTGSHGGRKTPDDTGAVTAPWVFFGNTGHEFTANNGVTLQSETGNTAVLDFTNWRVTWNSIPEINMGGSPDFDNTGLASMSCWSDAEFTTAGACADGNFYYLTYAANVPLGDPSNFGGVLYELRLEGKISSVPVPAAVWLFGSGLMGLMSTITRKK